MALLKLKVSPGASRNALLGWQDQVLKVAVSAAPDKGKANAAVIRLLAKELRLPACDLRITAGLTSRRKTLRIDNLDDPALQSRLSKLLE